MNSLGNRYASALLSIALDEGKNAEYREFMKEVYQVVCEDDSLTALLDCANLTKDEKKDVIDKVFKDCPYPYIVNFFKVIVDNNRGLAIKDILKEFISLSNEHDGISEGFIYCYKKYSEEDVEKISSAIASRIHKKVYLVQKVDENLLGGFRVVINDYVFDASVLSKLNALKADLLEGR